MAELVFTDCDFTLNSQDLSDHVKSISLNLKKEIHDITAMSATSRERIVGLGDFDMSVTFNADFADNDLDEDLYDIFNGGVAVAMVLRADSAAIGVGNPEYTGNVILGEYSPINASIGEAGEVSITLTGTAGCSRATA